MTRTKLMAATLWLLTICLVVGALVLDERYGAPHEGLELPGLAIPLIILAFSTTGFFISTRRPGHLMSRLYLISGVLGGLYVWSRTYSLAAKLEGWPGFVAGRVAEQFFYFPWVLSMIALPIMLFPNGRLPSHRWRWLRWVGVVFTLWALTTPFVFSTLGEEATVADVVLIDSEVVTKVEGGVIVTAGEDSRMIETEVITTPAGDLLFADGEDLFVTESDPDVLQDSGEISNPLATDALAPLSSIWSVLGLSTLVTILAAAPAALVVRFRSSEGIERQQMKWLVYPAAVAGVGLILTYTLDTFFGVFDTWWLQSIISIALLALLMIPVATGLAIVRYRLYDIDRLISRTVVYGVLVALLAAVFTGGVFLVGQLLPDENSISVAISTLAVAALFNPLRVRIQDFMDRRLYRSRYDAREIVQDFSDRLQDDIEFETIERELLEVVDEAVKPEASGLWIRQP